MPDDKGSAGQNRFLSKARWKGKKQNSDETSEKEAQARATQEQVLDFLRPAATKSPYVPPAQHLGRLDTSSAKRWPAANDIRRASTTPVGGWHARQASHGRSRSPRRNKKGANVNFTDAWPEIIGEGGDECEVPACEVASARRSHSRPELGMRHSSDGPRRPLGYGQAGDDPSTAAATMDTSRQGGTEGSTELPLRPPPAPKRRSTSGGVLRLEKRDDDAEDGRISPLTAEQEELAASAALKNRPISVFQATSQAMRAEEGRALSSGLRDMTPPGSRDEMLPDDMLSSHGANPSISIPPPVTSSPSPNLSFRAPPSPQPATTSYFSVMPRNGSPTSMEETPSPPRSAPRTVASAATPTSAPSRAGGSNSDDGAFDDFSSRVQHMATHFQLSAESVEPMATTPASEWVRAGVWWFLKGQAEVENAIRLYTADRYQRSPSPTRHPNQAYVNLAKAWWISRTIVPFRVELTDHYDHGHMRDPQTVRSDPESSALVQTNFRTVRQMRALTTIMKKSGFLPPASDEPLLTQSLDNSVWVPYPHLAPDVGSLLSGASQRSMVATSHGSPLSLQELMPMQDSEQSFSYGRMFVQAALQDEYNELQNLRMDCILSMTRNRRDWQMSIAVATQSGLINVCVQPDPQAGLTWRDVQWRTSNAQLIIHLPRSIRLKLQLREQDFQTLWDIFNYTQKVQASFEPEAGEILVFEDTLVRFHYLTSDPRSARFPKEPVDRCRVRLFEKKSSQADGVGTRQVHRGYRLMIISSPKVKTLSSISHMLGQADAVMFGLLKDDRDVSGLVLKIREPKARSTNILSFQDSAARNRFLSLLRGNLLRRDEVVIADIPCKAFSIERRQRTGEPAPPRHDVVQDLGFQQIRVIDKGSEGRENERYGRTILSESLRLCLESKVSTLTDRINLGPEQFNWRIDVKSQLELQVLRGPQEDLTVSAAEHQVAKNMPDVLGDLLHTVRTCETIRHFRLFSLNDLHHFLNATTGSTVLFDGISTSFAISRKRMVVPVHKKWEANMARILIVQRERVVLMVVFFADFAHGKCMNFQLKGQDSYESFSKSGKHYVRLVDAKFALPRVEGTEAVEFLCLDIPEYPSEHDDINLAFDKEEESERFQKVLPAPVTKLSRMALLTR